MSAEIIEGINHIWNNNFDEAEKIFSPKKDTHPRYALHNAEVAFLRSFITADTSDTEAAIARLKAAKNLAEDHVNLYEKNQVPPGATLLDKKGMQDALLDCQCVLGDSLYMLAVLQLTRDSKLKGALNLRKSWKVFEDGLKAVKHSKEDHDEEIVRCLNFGAGFFFFALSIVPAKYLKFIELAGFKADRELGLKYINDCHEAGGIRSPFATMVLLFNNLLLPRGLANPAKYLREADSLIKESLAKYPNGSLIQVMASHCSRKQCNVDEGIKFMEDAIDNCKNLNASPLIYKYELANCFKMKLKFEDAAVHFEPLVEAEKFQVRALCALQLACCYFMTGNKDKANATLARVPNVAKKSSSVDPYVVHQASRYATNGGHFSAFEMLYIRRDLAKMEKSLDQLMTLLEAKAAEAKGALTYKPDPSAKKGFFDKKFAGLSFGKSKKEEVDHSPDNRASYMLIKGALLRSMEKPVDAIQCFREVIALEDYVSEHAKWFIPYALFELGESMYHQGEMKGAQDAMKKCNNMGGYDWEDPLKVRLRVTIDQLKKGGIIDGDMDEIDGAQNITPRAVEITA